MTAQDRADLDELEQQEAETSTFSNSLAEDQRTVTEDTTTLQARRLRSEQEMDEERLARCPTNPPGNCEGNCVYDCDHRWDEYAAEGLRLHNQRCDRERAQAKTIAEARFT